ncbi:MAG: SMC-Scp complex subunit ScpB [Candidatus Thermoplasmatota archaeon]|jgi:segregation and condensation protein B|nr:SMC-Scp complex subunit ScpB [Candidatus Thermoplasmatota archaeon]|tara:strand:- start:127 stop:753 length:627 start_codon:yes stop_codon:yes gene_type:complete
MSSKPEIHTLLEAILFGAGKSMSVDELASLLSLRNFQIAEGLQELKSMMAARKSSALQLTEVTGRWIIEVKPEISPSLPESFKPEIPQRLLPAAALIAYHQPMPQAQLRDMLGPKAYDHVRDLASLGLIDKRRDGLTRRLTTTRRFAEYFGCPEIEYRKVRTWFREEASKLGLTSAQLAASLAPDEQMTISEFTGEDKEIEIDAQAEE